MPQSLSLVLVHDVFSTKGREPWIPESIRPALWAYLATVSRNAECECYRVGGIADHVHLVVRMSPTVTMAQLVEELKTSSSKWLKTQSPSLHSFAWQRGYGAFSAAPRDLSKVIAYIDNQEEHHRQRTFQDEFRSFLTNYAMDFDERYVWD